MLTLFLIHVSITGTLMTQKLWQGLRGMNVMRPWQIMTGCILFGYLVGWAFVPFLFLKFGSDLEHPSNLK